MELLVALLVIRRLILLGGHEVAKTADRGGNFPPLRSRSDTLEGARPGDQSLYFGPP